MSFTSPGNIIEPNFNPNSSQLPQNQKAKPLAQPSQNQSQKLKPMAMPGPQAHALPSLPASLRCLDS